MLTILLTDVLITSSWELECHFTQTSNVDAEEKNRITAMQDYGLKDFSLRISDSSIFFHYQ